MSDPALRPASGQHQAGLTLFVYTHWQCRHCRCFVRKATLSTERYHLNVTTSGMHFSVKKPSLAERCASGAFAPAMACRACLTNMPRVSSRVALQKRDMTQCSQHRVVAAKSTKQRRPQQQAPKGATSRPASSPSKTVTPPMKVAVEAQLAKLEQAANPWWSTFCGITNGVWLGQTAAFAPRTGEAEALALDKNRKPVLDMHSQVTEERVCDGPLDYVTRRTARAEEQAELATVGEQIAGQGQEWDEETLAAEEDGLVFFDGGAYSRGPLSLRSDTTSEAAESGHKSDETSSNVQSNQVQPPQAEEELDEEEEAAIAASPDEGISREGGARVVILEQCLAWGGEQRQRCCLVVAISGGGTTGEELDISLLRITLFHEHWQGLLHDLDIATLRSNSAVAMTPPTSSSSISATSPMDQSTSAPLSSSSSSPSAPSSSSASASPFVSSSASSAAMPPASSSSSAVPRAEQASIPSSSQATGVDALQSCQAETSSHSRGEHEAEAAAPADSALTANLSHGPRMKAKKLNGSWKAFDLTAVPIDETDPSTGITKKAMVYFSQETKQKWSASTSQQDVSAEEGEIDGGALWLPGNTVLELQMLPMVSRGEVADEVEGMRTSDTGRGVLISFSWLVRPGMMISMQREYDSAGDLMEVRSRSAVEGTWVGGRM